MENENYILNKAREFLIKSSDYYSALVARKRRDMEIASGNYWDDKLIDEYDRRGRICKSFSMYPKFCNAIVSPFSKSPYHADIEDPDGIYKEIQAELDFIENSNNVKFVLGQALRHATLQGTGFFVLSIVNSEITPEVIRDVSQVALDPNIQELDGKDAEQGAIVNFISINKAKRLYGDDVISNNEKYILGNFGDQWNIPAGTMPIVTYYEMNEAGTVDMYKLCGNKVVADKVEIPCSRIPIFRICFNEIVRGGKIDYAGIVDMTADLQFGMNLGYSTLLERANRSPKASYMMPAKALDGLDEFYKKLHTKESLVCLYNGDVAPQPIIESYQTQDLMATIQSCNDLMASTIGIPSQGINPVANSQTATEILIQQNNSESNVESLYQNANDAIFEFNKAIIEMLCWQRNIEKVPTFKLINGPQVITKMQKRRQELLAVSQLVDEKTRKIIAKQYVETLDEELKEPLLADIIANTEDINFISDSDANEDPRAVAVLNRMGAVLQETQDELEKQMLLNAEQKNQIDQLQLQLMNMKETNILNYQKHLDEMSIKQQELNIKAAEANIDMQQQMQDNEFKAAVEQTKLEKEMISLEKAKLDIVDKAIGG